MKIWRPRFSLRTLFVLVTLMCVYFAAWEVTKRNGIGYFEQRLVMRTWLAADDPFYSPMPFVVGVADLYPEHSYPPIYSMTSTATPPTERHFIWFFDWTWETPIRWEIDPSDLAVWQRFLKRYPPDL